jgi:hypothetical protein
VAQPTFRQAQRIGIDAWEKEVHHIASLVPDWDVHVATDGLGREYFSGIFRALNDATHVLCDRSPYDSLTEDWIINQIAYQVVFNLYLAPWSRGSSRRRGM